MKKSKHIEKAYQFFCDAEKNNLSFSIDDICDATGWRRSTVIAYLTKKWHSFVREDNGIFYCKGLCGIEIETFYKIHSQRANLERDIFRPNFSPQVDMLLDKSRDAILLAIQVYNNPTAVFRTYSFIVHIVISFTSLFHAIFERDKIEYWYKDKNGSPKIIDDDYKYWELKTCLEKYFKKPTAETENLNLLIQLRNKIEHRLIVDLDLISAGYCQAAVLNYEILMVDEFGKYFSLGERIFLALQISSFNSDLQKSLKRIQNQHYDEIRQYIDQFRKLLPDEILQSQNFCFTAFVIPKIGNHAKSSDIALEFIKYDAADPDQMEQYEKQIALIKERIIQVADQGKLRASDVVNEVSRRTGIHFNMHKHTQAWKYYQIRTPGNISNPRSLKSEYCQYSEPFKNFVYTEKWVEFLCKKIVDTEELERIMSINKREYEC